MLIYIQGLPLGHFTLNLYRIRTEHTILFHFSRYIFENILQLVKMQIYSPLILIFELLEWDPGISIFTAGTGAFHTSNSSSV
jgi:hypothetical protein